MEQADIYWNQEITHDSDDFTSQIEWVGDLIYLHCKVHKNTPSSIRAVKRELSRLLERFYNEGIDEVYCYLEKGAFARMLGGSFLTSFYIEGKNYEVYSYATSSRAGGGGNCSRREHIFSSTAEQGSEASSISPGGRCRHSSSPTEEPRDASPSRADSEAENPSSADSTVRKQSRSLDEFW